MPDEMAKLLQRNPNIAQVSLNNTVVAHLKETKDLQQHQNWGHPQMLFLCIKLCLSHHYFDKVFVNTFCCPPFTLLMTGACQKDPG